MWTRKLVWLAVTVAILGGSIWTPPARAASNEEVTYRLQKWTAAHFDSAKDAQKIQTTLKQLGCEVRLEAHNGHTDVVYRCMQWKIYRAKSHDEAHQWEKWFQTYGFETQHDH